MVLAARILRVTVTFTRTTVQDADLLSTSVFFPVVARGCLGQAKAADVAKGNEARQAVFAPRSVIDEHYFISYHAQYYGKPRVPGDKIPVVRPRRCSTAP